MADRKRAEPKAAAFVDAVAKWKERVRSDNTTGERELSFHRSELYRIDAAHLTGAHSDQLPVASVYDRV